MLTEVQGQDPTPFFNINFLTPNTEPARLQWAELVKQEIAKIGINVTHNEITGWAGIGPRTWSYPFISYDYIPPYEDGGYDVLFVGWLWDLDGSMVGLYETSAITPLGDNHYQFSNTTYDAIFDQYKASIDSSTRAIYSHQLQNIIYEELPAIGIIYQGSLYGIKEGLTGIDFELLDDSSYRIEYWDDPDDHIIKYGISGSLSEPNAFRCESYYDNQWMNQVYGSPIKRAQSTHNWEVECASSISTFVESSSGRQIVNVSLDSLAKFSDGNTVLPEDLQYTYQLHMSPKVSSSDYWFYTLLFGSNDSIYIDPTTGNVPGGSVIFNMTNPDNFWEYIYNIQIIDKSDIEPRIAARGYDIFDIIPLSPTDTFGDGYALVKSCGPMMLDTYDYVSSIVKLVPNPYWHGDPVDLTEYYLTFIAGKDTAVNELIAGNIDILDGQFYPIWDDFNEIGINGILARETKHQELSINLRHPVLGTGELTPVGTEEAARKIRQAISCCIPRQYIVENITNDMSFPGIIPLPDSCADFDSSLTQYPYDISLAKLLMEQAGYNFAVISEFNKTAMIIFLFTGIVSIFFLRKKKI